MYLDNILITKNADPSISYSEILLDSMTVSESVQEAEALALTSEFSNHTLGSEAASDWWPKIKAFFKKIWESLKRMFAKVVAWIAALPNKIVALCKKIYAVWVKRGLEGKMKNLRKNVEKKIVGLNPELAKDFNDTDWGFQDPLLLSSSFKKLVEKARKDDADNDFAVKILTGALTREVIREAVQGASKGYAEVAGAEDEGSSLSELKERIRNICDDVRSGIEQTIEDEYKDKVISLANLEEWYATVKNDTFAKEFKKISKLVTISIEVMDRLHEKAYKEFETLYKNDDEDGVKMLTLELKGINLITQAAIYAEGFLARIYATAALNRAKMVVAGIKCFDAQGAKNGGGEALPRESSQTRDGNNPPPGGAGAGQKIDGKEVGKTGKAGIVDDPTKQKNTPPTPKKGKKPKPIGSAESFISPGAMSLGIPGYNTSVFADPDFAAFMKM